MSLAAERTIASLSPRGVATRAKLIAVAERLFAERGIAGVSLNEINRAAHQRHSNACQYHFGNKDGLVQAILDKHVPGIAARRNAMFDEMEMAGTLGLEAVVKAFVRPVADKLFDPDGGKDFIRFDAQLIAQATAAAHKLADAPFTFHAADRLTRTLQAAMAARGLPPVIARQRLMMGAIMLFHGLADYSRLLDAAGSTVTGDAEIFIRDLEAMILGALTAPVEEATLARLPGAAGAARQNHAARQNQGEGNR
jgi:AcrR family transcriptional regulator